MDSIKVQKQNFEKNSRNLTKNSTKLDRKIILCSLRNSKVDQTTVLKNPDGTVTYMQTRRVKSGKNVYVVEQNITVSRDQKVADKPEKASDTLSVAPTISLSEIDSQSIVETKLTRKNSNNSSQLKRVQKSEVSGNDLKNSNHSKSFTDSKNLTENSKSGTNFSESKSLHDLKPGNDSQAETETPGIIQNILEALPESIRSSQVAPADTKSELSTHSKVESSVKGIMKKPSNNSLASSAKPSQIGSNRVFTSSQLSHTHKTQEESEKDLRSAANKSSATGGTNSSRRISFDKDSLNIAKTPGKSDLDTLDVRSARSLHSAARHHGNYGEDIQLMRVRKPKIHQPPPTQSEKATADVMPPASSTGTAKPSGSTPMNKSGSQKSSKENDSSKVSGDLLDEPIIRISNADTSLLASSNSRRSSKSRSSHSSTKKSGSTKTFSETQSSSGLIEPKPEITKPESKTSSGSEKVETKATRSEKTESDKFSSGTAGKNSETKSDKKFQPVSSMVSESLNSTEMKSRMASRNRELGKDSRVETNELSTTVEITSTTSNPAKSRSKTNHYDDVLTSPQASQDLMKTNDQVSENKIRITSETNSQSGKTIEVSTTNSMTHKSNKGSISERSQVDSRSTNGRKSDKRSNHSANRPKTERSATDSPTLTTHTSMIRNTTNPLAETSTAKSQVSAKSHSSKSRKSHSSSKSSRKIRISSARAGSSATGDHTVRSSTRHVGSENSAALRSPVPPDDLSHQTSHERRQQNSRQQVSRQGSNLQPEPQPSSRGANDSGFMTRESFRSSGPSEPSQNRALVGDEIETNRRASLARIAPRGPEETNQVVRSTSFGDRTDNTTEARQRRGGPDEFSSRVENSFVQSLNPQSSELDGSSNRSSRKRSRSKIDSTSVIPENEPSFQSATQSKELKNTDFDDHVSRKSKKKSHKSGSNLGLSADGSELKSTVRTLEMDNLDDDKSTLNRSQKPLEGTILENDRRKSITTQSTAAQTIDFESTIRQDKPLTTDVQTFEENQKHEDDENKKFSGLFVAVSTASEKIPVNNTNTKTEISTYGTISEDTTTTSHKLKPSNISKLEKSTDVSSKLYYITKEEETTEPHTYDVIDDDPTTSNRQASLSKIDKNSLAEISKDSRSNIQTMASSQTMAGSQTMASAQTMASSRSVEYSVIEDSTDNPPAVPPRVPLKTSFDGSTSGRKSSRKNSRKKSAKVSVCFVKYQLNKKFF